MAKVIIAGSRDITPENAAYMLECLDEYHRDYPITEVVSGTARGSDRLGEMWAKANNIPIKQFKPDWNLLGKRAGLKRNEEMAAYADRAIVFWNGISRGSKHMIDTMEKVDKPITVWRIEPKNEDKIFSK